MHTLITAPQFEILLAHFITTINWNKYPTFWEVSTSQPALSNCSVLPFTALLYTSEWSSANLVHGNSYSNLSKNEPHFLKLVW